MKITKRQLRRIIREATLLLEYEQYIYRDSQGRLRVSDDDGNDESELLIDDEWIPISIRPRYQQNDRPITPQQVSPSSDVVPNKLLDELRSQGLPIDEDHAALGMVYTNPIEQEERSRAPQSSEETPIDQGYDAVYEAMWSPEEGN